MIQNKSLERVPDVARIVFQNGLFAHPPRSTSIGAGKGAAAGFREVLGAPSGS